MRFKNLSSGWLVVEAIVDPGDPCALFAWVVKQSAAAAYPEGTIVVAETSRWPTIPDTGTDRYWRLIPASAVMAVLESFPLLRAE